LPNVGPYIYDVSISGFTRSSIYIYDISSLRVNLIRIKTADSVWGSWHWYRQTAKQSLLTWLTRSDVLVCRATVPVVTVVCMQQQWAQYECIISMNVLCTPTCSRVSSWMKERMAFENRKLPGKWEMLLSLASQACTQLSDGETQITT